MQTLILSTWLSRKPHPWSFIIATAAALVMAVLSFVYLRDFAQLAQWMPASRDLVFEQNQFWRLGTSLFAHADEKHLLSNSFLFFILGSFMMGYFGFWNFPIMALLFGGLTNWIVLQSMPAQTKLIGMSGVVFWLGGAWLILYFLIERRKSLYQRAIRALGVGLILFFPAEAFDPSTSYKSHLIGFLLGLLWGLIYFLWNRKRF
ncbi:MAG: rhomboid family intramembrane serine protease, partial [Pseudobdellovibrionaceae bacterium]